MSEGHTKERLRELQALPLERKIGFTAARIAEWHYHYHGQVYVAFSGGKDSTVLLYLARMLFPDIRAVFVDTGLEYPEIKEFVKTFENVEILRPKMNFKQVIDKYGYPVIGKEVATYINNGRKGSKLCLNALGVIPNGEYTAKTGRVCNMIGGIYDRSKYQYLLDAPFKISARCCDVMKKAPAKKYQRQTETYPMIATMAEESLLRKQNWIQHGCNAFDAKYPTSKPMSFWTEQDVLQYIKLKNIPIASVYGDVVESSNNGGLQCTGCRRTGCVFCLFGIMQDGVPNRIQRLAETHPKLYDYCLNKLGLKEVMDFIGVPYTPVIDLFNYQNMN